MYSSLGNMGETSHPINQIFGEKSIFHTIYYPLQVSSGTKIVQCLISGLATGYREICLLSVTVMCNSVSRNTGMFISMLCFLFYMSKFLKYVASKCKCTNSKEQIEAAWKEHTLLDQEFITFAELAGVA